MYKTIFLIFFLINSTFSLHSIRDYGAIPNDTSVDAAHRNTQAMIDASNSANLDPIPENRTVLIPAGYIFYFFTVSLSDLTNVTLRIDGHFAGSTNFTEWLKILPPFVGLPGPENEPDASINGTNLLIQNSQNITITGNGIVDGSGNTFWDAYWVDFSYPRIHLLTMFHCRDIEIYGLHFKNPGSWTLNFADVLNLHLYNVNITVDQINKTEMAIKHGISDEAYHAYPLFTDGMDIRGKNVLVENVHIQGFDDAIGVKEMNWGAVNFDNTFTDCSENMLIRNIIANGTYGVSIGSIHPDITPSCIRNITFENIELYNPKRAINIKMLRGIGNATVDQITFRNFYCDSAESDLLWLGPTNDPRGDGGCSPDFPTANNSCITNPNISVSNLLFENIIGINAGGIPGTFQGKSNTKVFPGLLWCDATNPCKNVTFINVLNDGNFSDDFPTYICKNVQGTYSNSERIPDSCFGGNYAIRVNQNFIINFVVLFLLICCQMFLLNNS